ncbi:sugar ABC transporter substrate-binding protein [Alkalihalobacillus pseudalcaliphilus]|uniref:sugar ABC transporter substrate-binding protein n=1 Tax=Alkalihalobacillus pseudalcaliphilus TaxID=79884 RepID=UPI00064E126B|nr:sugar ABC transporter substrate-binding protein [Alkalihalobacillus pseudalcaliphilus]KMK76184.1 sugar ABC transporter substrate-binding protein [Alkalihalobacillus pseudalcaliphilus]
MKKKLIGIIAVIFMIILVGCQSNEGTEGEEQPETTGAVQQLEGVPEVFTSGKAPKIKVVRKIGGDDHTAQFLAGAKEEAEALGFEVDIFTANGDSARFHDALTQDVDKYDGFIISHGDDEATVQTVKELRETGKLVVAFDSVPELQEIEGVTLTSQDDEQLADLSLNQLVEDFNGEANIVYLWVDGFPPMVRRNAVYQNYLSEHSGINELERFGLATDDTSVQTQNAVAAMLNKYPEGEIDAIFATWDAFAIGAAQAVREAGRDEISIYGIDVSNADLQEIQNEESSWQYTAAVDPKLIGAVNVRILAKQLAEEETPSTYNLEAFLISQEELRQASEPVNMINLTEVIDGWGQSDAFEEDWMKTLKEYHSKD